MGRQAYNPQRIIDAARALLADAATRCHAPDRHTDENIHDIRKALKKVRAYWRLMRYAVGKRYSEAGNARCKQAGRQLAGPRDHVVMLGTLDDLGKDAVSKAAMAFGQAKQAVHEAAGCTPTKHIDWDRVADLIRNDDAAWSGLDASAIDPADIRHGWERTRRKAQDGYRAVRRKPDHETLHDWRKWTKRWLEQEELLHPDKDKRINRLDELGEMLGRHHDLAVLMHRLRRNDHFGGKPQQRVRKTINQRQAGLEKAALKLGGKAFG